MEKQVGGKLELINCARKISMSYVPSNTESIIIEEIKGFYCTYSLC